MKLFKENITPRLSTLGDKIYPLVVDIKKGVKSGDTINFVTADNEVGILSIELVNGDEPYDISGCIVCGTIQRPDTSTLNVYCDIVGANKLEIPLGVSGTYQEGVHNFDLKIYRGNEKVIGVPTMSYTVTGSLSSDDVVEGDDRLPVLTTVLDNAQDKLTRLDKAIAGATNDLEVKEARDGEVTLNARLERDLAKGKIHFVDVEGSSISTESQEGYLEDVEIYGNTWQDANNLSDIRSVGTKVEGQELYEIPGLCTGKNLFDVNDVVLGKFVSGSGGAGNSITIDNKNACGYVFIRVKPNTTYIYKSSNIKAYLRCMDTLEIQSGLIRSYSTNTTLQTLPTTNYLAINVRSEDTATNPLTFEMLVNSSIQLEEGTQVTPYEPYQEDKLTILSPTPLEKVGNVADRIICKDGVWGVEKNVGEIVLNGSEEWVENLGGVGIQPNTKAYGVALPSAKGLDSEMDGYSNILPYNKSLGVIDDVECFKINSLKNLYVRLLKSRVASISEFKKWLETNNMIVKYQLATHTFIPLPHSQQIKLRTFANKTHISFDTEIQPTLKAQVSKSLGATVNTHTTQIDNLNKELDRVKKLEESTVSTVTTDKAFTTVSETTQGYFEDVKIEGKTLVNLFGNGSYKHHATVKYHCLGKSLFELEVGKTYTTLIKTNNRVDVKQQELIIKTVSADSIFTFKASKNLKLELVTLDVDVDYDVNILLLEGDHTDKDITFFEGLKSVGQDTDEISVLSVNPSGNLFNGTLLFNRTIDATTGVTASHQQRNCTQFINVKENKEIFITGCKIVTIRAYDENKNMIGQLKNNITPIGTKYIRFSLDNTVDYSQIYVGYSNNSEYVPYQSDKKPLLCYNPETQAWEKPILREWDSIEKHSDGKYYYHKRSEEVVLNGSGAWRLPVGERWNNKTLTCSFVINIKGAKGCTWGKYTPRELSSKFSNYGDVELYDSDIEGFTTDNEQGDRVFRVLRTKLSTQDVQGFKKWLQANPTTVVYQLAQEEVYECNNLDLITYQNETNLIVNSGAIQPKITLKVLSNVSNVVKLLQEKVSVLENKFIKGLQQVLAGDMMSLAHLLYPEDFEHEIQTLEL